MTTRLSMTLALIVTSAVAAAAPAQVYIPPPKKADQAPADPLAAYLTPDGRLRGPLEVRDEKKGFGTFAGMIYHIEPAGQWTITEIYRTQPYPRGQGVLTPKDLRTLAKSLLQYDLLHLPNVGRPNVNPHVLTVAFGGRVVEMTFGVDQVAVPPSDPSRPTTDPVSRYGGIAGAVRGLLNAPPPRGVPVGGG